MDSIITTTTHQPIALPTPLPEPRVGITIRPGTMQDIAFIDKLQKKQSREVGFFPTQAIEGKIRLGHVLVAEATGGASGQWPVASEDKRVVSGQWSVASEHAGAGLSSHSPLTTDHSVPVGYLIGNDQYFKRDDVGCIFQINVAAEYRRSLVAATLLKAQFERSSYGCRLYCCWCAQDIAANRFWESMGFVPLAYRAGSLTRGGRRSEVGGREERVRPTTHDPRRTDGRVHIFWQKRIREGDTGDVSRGGTAWWFPFKTNGGAMRADRVVLPIPPGARWDDQLPRLEIEQPLLPAPSTPKKKSKPTTKLETVRNGVRFCIPLPTPAASKPVREKKPKPLADPKVAAAARELRDKYLEQVHAGAFVIEPNGKYQLERRLPESTAPLPAPLPAPDPTSTTPTTPLLAA